MYEPLTITVHLPALTHPDIINRIRRRIPS